MKNPVSYCIILVIKVSGLDDVIDCEYGNENISKAFADEYCELYSIVSFDKNIMVKILGILSGNISNACLSKKCYSSHVIMIIMLLIEWKNLKLVNQMVLINYNQILLLMDVTFRCTT